MELNRVFPHFNRTLNLNVILKFCVRRSVSSDNALIGLLSKSWLARKKLESNLELESNFNLKFSRAYQGSRSLRSSELIIASISFREYPWKRIQWHCWQMKAIQWSKPKLNSNFGPKQPWAQNIYPRQFLPIKFWVTKRWQVWISY